jgi:hypothetical protein
VRVRDVKDSLPPAYAGTAQSMWCTQEFFPVLKPSIDHFIKMSVNHTIFMGEMQGVFLKEGTEFLYIGIKCTSIVI